MIKAGFSWQTFCHNKHIFVTTNNFVATSLLLSQQNMYFFHDKSMPVVTKLSLWQTWVCGNKYLSQEKFCRNKNILSWQTLNFSRGKHTFVATKYFCCDKTFLSQSNHLICQVRLYLQGIHKLQMWCINWSQQTWLLQKTCTHRKTGEIIFPQWKQTIKWLTKDRKKSIQHRQKKLTVRNTFSSLSIWNLTTKLKLM